MDTLRAKNLVVACGLLLMSGLLPAQAARVDNLYGATVEMPAGARNSMNAAFDLALAEVLVKVTGQPGAGDAAVRKALPSGASLVQQYSRLPENRIRAQFDPRAIRKALDSAGLPVWGEDRPLVAVWLAADAGGGRRVLLSSESSSEFDAADPLQPVREAVTDTAERRGLPVVIPLMDAQDLSLVSFTDVWGDFRTPVMQASERYRAEAVLIGRTRNLDPLEDRVRWSLTMGADQVSWEGDAASGPARAAEYLAQRFATTASSADSLRVLIKNVDSLEKYGQLKRYFASLNIVEEATLARVNGTELEFDLVVRGDQQRLERSLERNASLQPASSESDGLQFGRLPDLVYIWAGDAS